MGAGGEPFGQFEFGAAAGAAGAGGDAQDDAFGLGQDGAGHAGLPGEVEGVPFDARQFADLQLDGVDGGGAGFAHLLFRHLDDALDDGEFVHFLRLSLSVYRLRKR